MGSALSISAVINVLGLIHKKMCGDGWEWHVDVMLKESDIFNNFRCDLKVHIEGILGCALGGSGVRTVLARWMRIWMCVL